MLPPVLLELVALTQRSWRGLTAAMTQLFVEAASVCLHHHRPEDEVVGLHVGRHSGGSRALARVRLRRLQVTEQMLAAHDDLREATDRGATGLAVRRPLPARFCRSWWPSSSSAPPSSRWRFSHGFP